MTMRALFSLLLLLTCSVAAPAQNPEADAAQQAANTTAAAASTRLTKPAVAAPDFLEHLVDAVLERFDVRSGQNTMVHFALAALF
jgi:hypothetical protein